MEFTNPHDCDKCQMFGTLCALHRKMEHDGCGYCRRKGSPCARHGGEPSHQSPKTQRVPIAEAPQPKRMELPSTVDANQRPDPEIAVLDTVAKSLRMVDAAARQRIMTYLHSRYLAEELVKPQQQVEKKP